MSGKKKKKRLVGITLNSMSPWVDSVAIRHILGMYLVFTMYYFFTNDIYPTWSYRKEYPTQSSWSHIAYGS
jgi:hypothetical protein